MDLFSSPDAALRRLRKKQRALAHRVNGGGSGLCLLTSRPGTHHHHPITVFGWCDCGAKMQQQERSPPCFFHLFGRGTMSEGKHVAWGDWLQTKKRLSFRLFGYLFEWLFVAVNIHL